MADASIRLSVNTKRAERDLQALDKQLQELGKGKMGSTPGTDKAVSEQTKRTKETLQNLDNINKQLNTLSARNSQDQKRIADMVLQNSNRIEQAARQAKKASEVLAKRESDNRTAGSSGAGGGGTQAPVPSGGGGLGGLAKIVGLSAVSGLTWAVTQSLKRAAEAQRVESKSFSTYNKTGMFGSDFWGGKRYAQGIGTPYGMSVDQTMDFQRQYMSQAGYSGRNALTSDSDALLRAGKGLGIDPNDLASVGGRMSQTGVVQPGNMKAFTNMLAGSIRQTNMVGREDEMVEILGEINDTLGKNMVNVSQANIASFMGMNALLAQSNPNLRGQRGNQVVQNIHQGITQGGDNMDILLGWGTELTGEEGLAELDRRKQTGLGDPENIERIFKNMKKFGTEVTDDPRNYMGNKIMQENFNLTRAQVDAIVQARRNMAPADYQAFLKTIQAGDGSLIDKGMGNYNASKVSTQEKFTLNWENAELDVGNFVNETLKPLKAAFNDAGTEVQAGAVVAKDALTGFATALSGINIAAIIGGALAGGLTGAAATAMGKAGKTMVETGGKPVIEAGKNIAKGAGVVSGGFLTAFGVLAPILAMYKIAEGAHEKYQDSLDPSKFGVYNDTGETDFMTQEQFDAQEKDENGETIWKKAASHAGGKDFVPYDNYLARLHRGEKVLTAKEASEYRTGNDSKHKIDVDPEFTRQVLDVSRIQEKVLKSHSNVVEKEEAISEVSKKVVDKYENIVLKFEATSKKFIEDFDKTLEKFKSKTSNSSGVNSQLTTKISRDMIQGIYSAPFTVDTGRGEAESYGKLTDNTKTKLHALKGLIEKNYGKTIAESIIMTSGMRAEDFGSHHSEGTAVDLAGFPLTDKRTRKEILALAESLGMTVLDEYEVDTENKTGDHIHLTNTKDGSIPNSAFEDTIVVPKPEESKTPASKEVSAPAPSKPGEVLTRAGGTKAGATPYNFAIGEEGAFGTTAPADSVLRIVLEGGIANMDESNQYAITQAVIAQISNNAQIPVINMIGNAYTRKPQ